MADRCEHHDHPALSDPVSEATFRAELEAVLLGAGIPERKVDAAILEFPEELGVRHEGDPRAYAEVNPHELLFRFAPQALLLPEENRLGLLAHEVGHVIDPLATENGADRAVERRLGVRIVYDPRWPGKGLQRLVKRGDSRKRALMR